MSSQDMDPKCYSKVKASQISCRHAPTDREYTKMFSFLHFKYTFHRVQITFDA